MDNGLKEILLKIKSFIRKYYVNSMLKGVILALSISGIYILSIILAEYFGHFTKTVRTTLFIVSLAVIFVVWIYYILIPLSKLWGLSKRISEKKAAQILGKHFPEIGDKLQNTIELAQLIKDSPSSVALIEASIKKRTEQLRPIPFRKAIDYRKNIKYLKYLLPVAFIFSILLIIWPKIISEGSERIIRFNKEFIPPPPFSLIIENDTLVVKRGSDFKIRVRVEGNNVPNEVNIYIGANKYLMKKENNREFSYLIKSLNNSINIKAESGIVTSPTCEIKVLPSPSILNLIVGVTPPAYTGIPPSFYTNNGDISLPYGSIISWQFNTTNISQLNLIFNDSTIINTGKNNNIFSVKKQILQSSKYSISSSNDYFKDEIVFTYNLNVIPDLFPSIILKQVQDSVDMMLFYFSGTIDDDYGFSSLNFFYKTDSLYKIALPISKGMSAQKFYYAFDFSKINMPDKKVSYYFEVGDNDAIRGSKITRSETFEFVIPSIEEIESRSEEANKSISSKMTAAKNIANEIQRDISNMRQKMMNENLSDWEKQQMMKEIAEKQQKMEQLINEAVEENKKINEYKNNFSDQEKILEKQKQIEELLNELMDDEMRKLMEELQKLMQNFDPKKFEELTKEMSMSYEELNKQLDQNLEMLKRMEVEERVKNTIDKLEQLSKEQQELAEKTKDEKSNKNEILEEQKNIEDKLKNIQEEYQKTLEKNEDLKTPYNLDDFNQDFQDIKNEINQAEDNLQKNKDNKASKNQQNSSQKMKDLGDKMQSMLEQNTMMQAAENLDDLRQIVENLLSFSFDQEGILLEIGNHGVRSPKYRELIVTQRKITDDFVIIRDSLNSLAMRMPEIDAIIRKEINIISRKLEEVMNKIGEINNQNIKVDQQLIMTSANNLILLLDELMKQMQQQMAMQMSGNQNCKKCKSPSKGQMGELRDLQQGMKQQMQQMIDQMKNGGDKSGNQQSKSQNLAKMLAQQEIMQQMLNEMINSGQLSPESAKILNEINRMMEENIKDLINGNITPQTIQRQELILTRMLEVEKSEHEREIDNKRKSNEARDYKISNPGKAFDEKEKEMRFNELLRYENLNINQFYKLKYKNYLKKLE